MGVLSKRLIAIICAVLTIILVRDIVRSDVLTRIRVVTWTVSHSTPLDISFAVQSRYPDRIVNRSWSHEERITGGASAIAFRASMSPKTLFTTKFKGEDSRWVLERVQLRSPFGEEVSLEGKEILEYFYAPAKESELTFENNQVVLSTRGAIGEVFSRGPFRLSNRWLEIGLPIISGFIVFVLLSYVSLSLLPSIRQLKVSSYSGSSHSLELDGLRGLAAIFVVADHTWGMFSGAGLFGVWIFFALSGYLLSIPFVRDPERALDREYAAAFYIRRLMRILPMYYFVLFAFFLSGREISLALSHFLFLQGNGHFWTIVQEMLFYLILPLIMIVMALLMRVGVVLAVGVFTVLTVLALIYYQIVPINLYDGANFRPPFFGWFMVGVLVSYICHSHLLKQLMHVTVMDWFDMHGMWRHLVGLVAVVLLFGLFGLASTQYFAALHGPNMSYADIYNGWYGAAAGFLIFAAVVARSSVYGVVLRFLPFRSFGILGYSVYLLHPMLLGMVMRAYRDHHLNPPSGIVLFSIVLAVTWVVATITYNLIEHPFLSYRVDTKKSA